MSKQGIHEPFVDVENDVKEVANAVGIDNTIRPKKKMSRKERKAYQKQFKEQARASKAESKQIKARMRGSEADEKKRAKSISQQLKERDKSIAETSKFNHGKRNRADNVIDYIGYDKMFYDGICEVEEGVFSQTLAFPDISYQSARDEDQRNIFNTMCAILNSFEPKHSFQFSVVNTMLSKTEIGNRTFFKEDKQRSDRTRRCAHIFNDILNQKMKEGISNIKRVRCITYAVAARSLDEAVRELAHIRLRLVGLLKEIGCDSKILNGTERLELLHNIYNPETVFDFSYDRDISLKSGLTTKDCIAPVSIDFKPDGDNTCFMSGDKWCQVLYFKDLGSEISDRVISNIVDLPIPMTVSWFGQSWDRGKAIDFTNLRSTWVDKEIYDEQRKSANKGHDFTVLSSEVRYNQSEVSEVLDNLRNKNQNLFSFSGFIYVYGSTREELDNRILDIISTARTQSVTISTLPLLQKQALNSVIPVGSNHVDIVSRTLTTAQMAIFMPFATQELDDEDGNYAGQNKNSNNLVLVNRKRLDSPGGFVAGKTGSGKSFFVKQEITCTRLNSPNDQIIIFDRAGEYTGVTEYFGGQVFKLDVDSNTHVNPFDISQHKHQTKEQQITNKVNAMLAQANASASDKGIGLADEEESIIQRCVEQAFAKYAGTDQVPIMQDFYDLLLAQPEPAAQNIALRYERFVKGTTSFFNNQSNVDWSNPIIDINIKDLPDSMLLFALIVLCEAARNQTYANYEKKRRTWIYIEEIQSMFQFPAVLDYFARFSAEARKFGGLLTGITQNSTLMLENKAAKPILLNADYVMLLKQSWEDQAA